MFWAKTLKRAGVADRRVKKSFMCTYEGDLRVKKCFIDAKVRQISAPLGFWENGEGGSGGSGFFDLQDFGFDDGCFGFLVGGSFCASARGVGGVAAF